MSQHHAPPEGGSPLDVERGAVDDEAGDPNVPSRHKRPPPHPTRSGEVRCLRCGNPFFSWDRTLNRICPSCSGRA